MTPLEKMKNMTDFELLKLHIKFKKNESKIKTTLGDIRTVLIERFKISKNITEFIDGEYWGVREILTSRSTVDHKLLMETVSDEQYNEIVTKKPSKSMKISKVKSHDLEVPESELVL